MNRATLQVPGSALQHAQPPAAPGAAARGAAAPGLGLDAGGTQTRWALAGAEGRLLAEGEVEGLSGTQMASADGRAAAARTLAALAAQLRQALPAAAQEAPAGEGAGEAAGSLAGVVAGVTGFGDEHRATLQQALRDALAGVLAAPPAAAQALPVLILPDIELLCRASFVAGEGIVLLAGTGSIAACLDAQGQLQRAGGRGHVIDDAGSGHWIASRALRAVWRAEDAAPGSALATPLGRCLAAAIGGADWAAVRAAVYGASRGDIGRLALAVAEAATGAADPAALALLEQAGRELARLVLALAGRQPPLPCTPPPGGALQVALAGRVFDLHPCIRRTLQAALPAGTRLQPITHPAHHSAARLAAGAAPPCTV